MFWLSDEPLLPTEECRLDGSGDESQLQRGVHVFWLSDDHCCLLKNVDWMALGLESKLQRGVQVFWLSDEPLLPTEECRLDGSGDGKCGMISQITKPSS